VVYSVLSDDLSISLKGFQVLELKTDQLQINILMIVLPTKAVIVGTVDYQIKLCYMWLLVLCTHLAEVHN